MSRWTHEFGNHAFRKTWEDLTQQIGAVTLDDETVDTAIAEAERLRKASTYISELLENIDPELIPLSTWNKFEGQASACLKEVTSYNSNRNVVHIVNANNHVDNLLTYVRPYMVLPKNAAAATTRASIASANVVEEYVDNLSTKVKTIVTEIEALKLEAESDRSSIAESKAEVQEFESELFGADGESGRKKEFADLISDVEAEHGEINATYNEILVTEEGRLSTKQEIIDAKADAVEKQREIAELLSSVATEVSELEEFFTKTFGKERPDGTRVGGLNRDLDALKSSLTAFENAQKERYEALNSEIESLIPGATSAGLATAYKEMKDSFDGPIWRATMLFLSSIAVLVIGSFLLTVDSIGWTQLSFKSLDTWDTVLKGLSHKLPFYAPMVWLAFYATKRRSEAQRLQQEYAHKEALAKSYNSYKRQILELGEETTELQAELLGKAIEAIAHNASETLDGRHGDKMPTQEAIDVSSKKLPGVK